MNEFLQIVGSLASIIGIPLAIYFYLKGQAEKYFQVRREIVKRLSHQVGEGRELTIFELNAVIISLVREKRLKQSSISPNSIVEDLIAETISSPLLDKGRKNSLVVELRQLHSKGKVYEAIETDVKIFDSFVGYIQAQSSNTESSEITEIKIGELKPKEQGSNKRAEVFGITAAFITALTAYYTFSLGGGIVEKLASVSIEQAALLGSVIATLAGFVSGLVDWRKKK